MVVEGQQTLFHLFPGVITLLDGSKRINVLHHMLQQTPLEGSAQLIAWVCLVVIVQPHLVSPAKEELVSSPILFRSRTKLLIGEVCENG